MPAGVFHLPECFARLHRAGWSVGEVQVQTPDGPAWLVTGTRRHGECPIRATGRTQAEAWRRAAAQAEGLA